MNEDDPPDLVVTWENGEKWGVEVTRTYQQVPSFKGEEPVSSETITATLRKFAEKFGEKTADIRKCGYTLNLEGPGRFSSWKDPVPIKKRLPEIEKAILRHIDSEESSILRAPGVWLKPGEPGKRWTITVNSGVAEISSATNTMLWRALEDKTEDLPNWKGVFDKRWLLLLNYYHLVYDLVDVKNALRQLVRENQELAGFNGIFWSGYPDWTLTQISLS